MTEPKQVNLLAKYCGSIISHLSSTRTRNGIFSAKFIKRTGSMFMFVLMFLLFQTGSLLAQEIEARGKVISADDKTELVGASVVEKGTTNGTATDINGEFKLKVKKGAVLVISNVGYSKEEVKVLDTKYLTVELKLEAKTFKEMAVIGIGYGEVKKADATGSVTAISAKDFSNATITSPQELLIGKAAGVVANTTSGTAGAGTKIRIRGGSSLVANNDPLIVIDNIPMESSGISGMANPLSTINPNDIESFTILKDASATAIYGSRASNGVIIITTKKGAIVEKGESKMLLNYSGSFSLATIGKKLTVFTGDEYRALIADRVANYGLASAAKTVLGAANTDWQNEIYQVAPTTEHNISISHSLEGVPYRASFDYMYQGGILKYNKIDRKNITLSVTPTLLDGSLAMDFNASASWIANNFSNPSAVGAALQFDPTQPIKNGNTRYAGYTTWIDASSSGINGTANYIATSNPVALLELRHNTSDVRRFILGGKFDYKIPYIPDLKATLNLGYDYYKSVGHDISDSTGAWVQRQPVYQIQDYGQTKENKLLDLYLNYKKELSFNKFDLTGGYSYQHFYNEGYNSNRAWNANIVGATYTPYMNEYYLVSFFGRLNYTAFDKYLLTFTLRDDGSSRFSKDNRWGLFPAVAAAWKLTEESFIGKSDIVNELKLRISWGKAGQQDVGTNYYPYIATYSYSTTGAYYQLGNTYYQTIRPNAYDANLKWETLTSLNAGLDFTLLDKRLSGSIEVYKNTSDDLLNTIPVAIGTNFSNYLLTNVGSMVNKGIELNLTGTPILEKDYSWEIGVNLTYNKNEITKLTISDDPSYSGVNTGTIAGGVGNTVQKYYVGVAANTFFLFTQVYDANGNPIEGVYVDKTGTGGNVAGNDLNKFAMKSPNPDVLMGISSKFNYKEFDLSFSGRLSLGNYVYNNNASSNAVYAQLYNQSGYLTNILTDVRKTNFATAQYWSSYYLENASFFKLDYISLGYNFTSLLDYKVSGRIGLSVQNVFTITKYSGLDPEVDGGIDNNIYPRPRTFMLSVSLNY
jgi:TonB-dependent starch-binding outer membrane protein SusC